MGKELYQIVLNHEKSLKEVMWEDERVYSLGGWYLSIDNDYDYDININYDDNE